MVSSSEMDVLREFLDNSTIHGLAHISSVSSKTGKALWMAIVIAGFCTAGYLINDSYKEWETTPVATSISTHPIDTLPLPIITICPPEHSNTALNVDLVKAGNISLTKADREALVNVSRQFFIHEPSQKFVDLAHRLVNEEAIPKLKIQTRSYPSPYENTDRGENPGFEIWSTELVGSYASPGFGSRMNCSRYYPSIHFTLYIPQKVKMKKGDLTNATFDIEIVALNDDSFEIEYREGDTYIFHGESHEQKDWSDAETHCNEHNGHLISIQTNYDYIMSNYYQQRKNKAWKKVWLGGSDQSIESIWVWSDGTPWANESVPTCSEVEDIQNHGLKTCTNWAPQNPGGGREKNCMVVDRSHQWRSDYCERKQSFWCQIPTKRLTGNTKLSWRLADIAFSKIELQLTKKAKNGANTCHSSSNMPGFSMTWSTNSSMNKVSTVPAILRDDGMLYENAKVGFTSLTGLRYTILSCRKINMTTAEIWKMVQIHKREMIEENRIGCYLGQVNDIGKLSSGLRKKMPRNRPKITYTETADDYTLAFEILSYLLFCQREQIEMAVFYNNLFRTANPRTILQATANNIQHGVENADTMVALHQIYKTLARKMELKLPYILQGFLDSKMPDNFDQAKDIFFYKDSKEDSKQTELPLQGKNLSTKIKLIIYILNA